MRWKDMHIILEGLDMGSRLYDFVSTILRAIRHWICTGIDPPAGDIGHWTSGLGENGHPSAMVDITI